MKNLVMKQAWKIRKSSDLNMSEALKMAWKAIKGGAYVKIWKGSRAYFTSNEDTRVQFYVDLKSNQPKFFKAYERNLAKQCMYF